MPSPERTDAAVLPRHGDSARFTFAIPGPAESPGGGDTGSADRPPPPSRPPVLHNIFYRLFLLFTAPSRAFARPRDYTLWLAPLLLVLTTQMIHTALLRDLYFERTRTFLEETPHLTEQQRTDTLALFEQQQDPVGPLQTVLHGLFGMIMNAAVVFFLPALIYLLGLNFGLGGNARFRDVLIVICFSALLVVLREAVTLPVKLAQQSLDVYTSPAAFAGSRTGWLVAALNQLDLFQIYRFVLLILGLSVVSGLSRRAVAILVSSLWALWLVIWISIQATPLSNMFPPLVP